MFKRKAVLMSIFTAMLLLFTSNVAEASSCEKVQKGNKVIWEGMELKHGQLGKLTILKDTPLFKLDGENRIFERTLKKGESYRIYSFKSSLLDVGGGYFVDRNEKVKYITPSKAKLNAVQCIVLQKNLMRGFTWKTTYNQIKEKELGKIVEEKVIENADHSPIYGSITYSAPNKYGIPVNVDYFYYSNVLKSISYRFYPDDNKHFSNSELESIFNKIAKNVSEETGLKMNNTSNSKGFSGQWISKGTMIGLYASNYYSDYSDIHISVNPYPY